MDATNEWMDETEKLLKSFDVGMDPEEASRLQEKTEVNDVLPQLLSCSLNFLESFNFSHDHTTFANQQNPLA